VVVPPELAAGVVVFFFLTTFFLIVFLAGVAAFTVFVVAEGLANGAVAGVGAALTTGAAELVTSGCEAAAKSARCVFHEKLASIDKNAVADIPAVKMRDARAG